MRRGVALLGGLAVLAGACAPASPKRIVEPPAASAPVAAEPAPELPPTGVQLTDLPEGEGQQVAQTSCLACHSSDIIRQQRITEAQWATALDKMIRWGADVPPSDRERLLHYLSGHFGPANDGFRPLETAPIDTASAR